MSDARIVQRGLEQLGIDVEVLRSIVNLQMAVDPPPSPLVGGPIAEPVTEEKPKQPLPKPLVSKPRPKPVTPVKLTKKK